ncbi:MAG: M15 family metallopeptidase [Selenomonadaceae bacterium]|nr:M15 family metallopeptidase [Selenomonadaceae bacterium]MBQ9497747.1 M15 family metallopeptidase [Selenomonadaceae bacterium]
MGKVFCISEVDARIFSRMDGKSFKVGCPVPLSELRHLSILHRNLRGDVLEGELVCHARIAESLVEIFEQLFEASYPIERVRLVDEYDADDEMSMRDNNSSCFNFRRVSFTDRISLHGYGMAVDINPLYNPYVKTVAGKEIVAPDTAVDFVSREKKFPYKIERSDLCCRLFAEHGFSWGGDWTDEKDYQHFFVEEGIER